MPKIGVLWSGTAAGVAPYVNPFLEGLKEHGWINGKTAHIAVRYADNDLLRLPALASELVSQDPDVLAISSLAMPAARMATKTIPIVAVNTYDPVEEGYTKSFAHPDGNITGVSWQTIDTAGKRLEMLIDLFPQLKEVAFLGDQNDFGAQLEAKGLRKAADTLGIKMRVFDLRGGNAAFASIKKFRPQSLVVATSALASEHLKEIVKFANANRLPTVSEAAVFADDGILFAFGPNIADISKRASAQVDRILKGAKPSDLPFEQPMRFDVVVNLQTAKQLRLKIPESIMVRATRIIR